MIYMYITYNCTTVRAALTISDTNKSMNSNKNTKKQTIVSEIVQGPINLKLKTTSLQKLMKGLPYKLPVSFPISTSISTFNSLLIVAVINVLKAGQKMGNIKLWGRGGIQRIEFQWSTILGTSNFGGKAHGHFKGWGKADWAFQVLNVQQFGHFKNPWSRSLGFSSVWSSLGISSVGCLAE